MHSIAIDYGSEYLRAGIFDGRYRLIASGKNLLEIREGSEIFFNDFVSSCLIAVQKNYTPEKLNAIKNNANEAGFDYVDFITDTQAKISALDENINSALILDMGASKTELEIISQSQSEKISELKNFNGNYFNKIFSEFLSTRLLHNIKAIEADGIKKDLTDKEILIIGGKKIYRYDFERLIRFHIFDAVNFINAMIRIYEPEKFFITGGLANIPIVKNIIERDTIMKPEFTSDLILKGASILAVLNDKKNDNKARLKALQENFKAVRNFLTPSQNDRVNRFFNQALNLKGNANINALENLLNELKKTAPESK